MGKETGLSRNRLHNSDTALNESTKNSINQLASREVLLSSSKDEVVKSHNNLHTTVIDDKNISRSKRMENLIHGESFHDPAHVVEIMTREAITEAAQKSQLSARAMTKNAALLSTGLKPSMNIHDTSSSRSQSVNTNLRDDSDDDEKEFEENEYHEEGDEKQMQDLFAYTKEYQPEAIELFPELKCFIPDYIPAIGDIDPMIKVGLYINADSSASAASKRSKECRKTARCRKSWTFSA